MPVSALLHGSQEGKFRCAPTVAGAQPKPTEMPFQNLGDPENAPSAPTYRNVKRFKASGLPRFALLASLAECSVDVQ